MSYTSLHPYIATSEAGNELIRIKFFPYPVIGETEITRAGGFDGHTGLKHRCADVVLPAVVTDIIAEEKRTSNFKQKKIISSSLQYQHSTSVVVYENKS
jgi:hypothetical protein